MSEEEATTEEIVEAIGHLNKAAQALRPFIGGSESPSGWDNLHVQINGLLDELEKRGALSCLPSS